MANVIDKFKRLKLTSRILIIALISWIFFLSYTVTAALSPSKLEGRASNNKEHSTSLIEAGKTMNLDTFDKIALRSPIELRWKPGDSSVCISNKDSEKIDVYIQDETLIVENKKRGLFSKGVKNIVLGCSSNTLNTAIIEGAGEIKASDISSDSFYAQIDGAGKIKAKGTTKQFQAEINGAGEMELNKLHISDASVVINGVGEIEMPKAQQASIEINGVGDVKVSEETVISSKSINGHGEVEIVND